MNVEEAKLERYLHEATHPRDMAWMEPISRSGEMKWSDGHLHHLVLGPRLFSPGTAWRRQSWIASTWPGPWTGSGTWRTDRTWRGLATTKCTFLTTVYFIGTINCCLHNDIHLITVQLRHFFGRQFYEASTLRIETSRLTSSNLILSFWKLSWKKKLSKTKIKINSNWPVLTQGQRSGVLLILA